MSIENNIERIANALEAIAQHYTGHLPLLPASKGTDEVPAPKKGRPGKPAKPAPEPDAEDTPAASESEFTKEQVRAALQNLPTREAGLEILGKFNAPTLSALKESDYAAVMALAAEAAE
jgi:hypothetical protein